jgi:hypothetical protein
MFGGLLRGMGSHLEQLGVQIPQSLQTAINDEPAANVGFGEGELLLIDGRLHYGSSWHFDSYRAAVTVHDEAWVGILAPKSSDLALATTEHLRPISW